MNTNMLERLFDNCQSITIEQALNALDDLGFLIERHITNSYHLNSYELLFNDKRYIDAVLENSSIEIIRYFLFFMIINFRDRASRVAWCLGKLPNEEYTEGVFRCIDVFLEDKDDNTVFYLVKSLCDEYGIQNMTQQIVNILIAISDSELIDSGQFAKETLSFYKENHQYLPSDITLHAS